MAGRMNTTVYRAIRKAVADRVVAKADDVSSDVGITMRQAGRQLRYYVDKGFLFRVGKGLYALDADTKVPKSVSTQRRHKIKAAMTHNELLVKCFNKMVQVK